MFPVTSRVTCVCATPGVYRLYYQSRRVGEAVTVDNEPLYVPHSFTESGRVVAPLRDAGCWLEAIEDNDASPLAAALKPAALQPRVRRREHVRPHRRSGQDGEVSMSPRQV